MAKPGWDDACKHEATWSLGFSGTSSKLCPCGAEDWQSLTVLKLVASLGHEHFVDEDDEDTGQHIGGPSSSIQDQLVALSHATSEQVKAWVLPSLDVSTKLSPAGMCGYLMSCSQLLGTAWCTRWTSKEAAPHKAMVVRQRSALQA